MPGLTCTRCGAALPPAAARAAITCPYCGTTSVPAPEVVERVVERIVVAAPPAVPGESSLRCPRCGHGLIEKRVRGGLVGGCPGCAGQWLDAGAAEKLRRGELQPADCRLGRIAVIHGPVPNRRSVISCPVCAGPLRRVDVTGSVHSVDVCDAHGTWFDARELEIVAEAQREARAGDVSDDDLEAAGVKKGGFFARLFRSRS